MNEEEFRKIAKEYAEMYFTKGINSTKIFYYYYVDELEKKVEQLENIRKEAIEECKSVIGNPEHTIVSKNELMKIMLNILNKGDNKG